MWRAFRVAESTMSLPLDGAAFVDGALAPFAHSLSWSQLERTIEKARTLYDPEEVQRRRDADPRRFDIRTHGTGIDGFTWVEGLMDAGDALDLDAAVVLGRRPARRGDRPAPRRPPLHGSRRDRPRPAGPGPQRHTDVRSWRRRLDPDDRRPGRRAPHHRHERPPRPGRRVVRHCHHRDHPPGPGPERPPPHRRLRPHRHDPRASAADLAAVRVPVLHPHAPDGATSTTAVPTATAARPARATSRRCAAPITG